MKDGEELVEGIKTWKTMKTLLYKLSLDEISQMVIDSTMVVRWMVLWRKVSLTIYSALARRVTTRRATPPRSTPPPLVPIDKGKHCKRNTITIQLTKEIISTEKKTKNLATAPTVPSYTIMVDQPS